MSRIESNIPQSIFYLEIKGEILRITCLTLCLRDSIPKTKELLGRMKQQGSKRGTTDTFNIVRNIISSSRKFPTRLYLMSGPLKHFLERKTVILLKCVGIYLWVYKLYLSMKLCL